MLLLNLPSELIDKILLCAVLTRGVKRALRLRLVCSEFSFLSAFQSFLQLTDYIERFSRDICPALYQSRLLDSFQTGRILSEWYIRNDHGMSTFWHSYLVYRVLNGTNPPQHRFLDIRQVAERICEDTGADLASTVETLCWPALQQGTNPGSDAILEREPSNPGLNLLCVAAYLNLIPMAKRLLQEGHSPTGDSRLFSSPMRLAAWAGNTHMLELFQEHMPELEGFDPALLRNDWRGKVGPASIMGAAIRGDVDMVRLAVYPPSRATPSSTDFIDQPFGSVDRRSDIGNPLHLAQSATKNVEVYKYLEKFFAEPSDLSLSLAKHARLGNLEMVRYLLDAGADTRGICRRDGNPVVEACRWCHEDVVDLLLERGADPNFDGDKERIQGDNPVAMAAEAGSLAIVRKLIDVGADLGRIETGYRALYKAVHLEHEAMVKLLLKSGVDLGDYGDGGPLLESAMSEGLDSMVELLQQEGATLS